MGNLEPKICCKQENVKIEQQTLPLLIEQESQNMTISKKSSRSELSPIVEVELAAHQLCKENHISEFYVPLLSRIITFPYQQYFLYRWKTFTQEQRSSFLESLNDIKLDLTDTLFQHFVKNKEREAKLKLKLQNAYAPELILQQFLDQKEKERIINAGLSLIRQNKVALVLMCAGSSSRFEQLNKFLQPIDTQGKVTIIDYIFNNLKQTLRGVKRIPIIINCNDQNLKPIKEHLANKGYYDLEADYFKFTVSSTFVVMDENGKYCLDQNFRIMKRAPGTAECAQNTFSQQIQKWLKDQQIGYVYFSGVENVKEIPCDPLLLGQVALTNRKIAVKCTKKFPLSVIKSRPSAQSTQPQPIEPFPRYYRCLNFEEQSRIHLLNESQFHLIARQKIQTMPIAMNSLAIEFRELRKIVYNYQKELSQPQPYHCIYKPETILDHNNNQLQTVPCYSFQRDIRQYISCFQNPILFVVDGNSSFLPILTKQRQYSLKEAEVHLESNNGRRSTLSDKLH